MCLLVLCACLPEGERVAFWQELVEVARHVRAISDLPVNLAGDANVWPSHFQVGRHRAVDDALIVLFVDLLLSSCGLVLSNLPHQVVLVLLLVSLPQCASTVVLSAVRAHLSVVTSGALTSSCALRPQHCTATFLLRFLVVCLPCKIGIHTVI